MSLRDGSAVGRRLLHNDARPSYDGDGVSVDSFLRGLPKCALLEKCYSVSVCRKGNGIGV